MIYSIASKNMGRNRGRNIQKTGRLFTDSSNRDCIFPLYIHVKYAKISKDGAVS